MEQRAKKYEELNKYERVMTNASLEQRIEAMARDLRQIAKALKLSVHVDMTYFDYKDDVGSAVYLIGKGEENCTKRDVEREGDLFGIIEEAKAKDAEMSKKDEGTD